MQVREVGRLGVALRELDLREEWMARITESEEAREEVTFLAPAKMRRKRLRSSCEDRVNSPV